MRLDHLLSKEHLLREPRFAAARTRIAGARSAAGAHGWNIDLGVRRSSSAQYDPSGSGTAAGDSPGTCTLLGPEGPGTANVAGGGAYGPTLPGGGRRGAGFSDFRAATLMRQGKECRPYVENYTVDASILETPTRQMVGGSEDLEI